MSAAAVTSSTPSFSEFDPTVIPYQDQVIDDIEHGFDYRQGVHKILLSGSVGSAKSILMAHCLVKHCLMFEKARGLLARKSMPDLRDTAWAKVVEHMQGSLIEGHHYEVNQTTGKITYLNGSEILCRSWADRAYKKVRSLELSAAAIEELTENDEKDKQAYVEIGMRLGRLPHVPHSWLMAATNPDAPSHWAYEEFELGLDEDLGASSLTPLGLGPNGTRSPTKHVYYSETAQNPFLPRWYIEQLKRELDHKMFQRMGRGRWLELKSGVIYHAYSQQRNFRDTSYTVRLDLPVRLSWDFNIGDGKPLSVSLCQYDPKEDTFHFFSEVVVEGMRTLDSCEELAERGLLNYKTSYIVHGDASGKHRDTRSKRSDYDIIQGFLANREGLRFDMQVPLSNPPIRTRHNTLNGYFQNALGEVRAYVYKDAPKTAKGFRLVKPKPGGNYVEDDSFDYQHVTCAAGYAVMSALSLSKRQQQGTRYI